jgi:hypothetical protein
MGIILMCHTQCTALYRLFFQPHATVNIKVRRGWTVVLCPSALWEASNSSSSVEKIPTVYKNHKGQYNYGLDVQGSIPSKGKEIFLFSAASVPALRSTQFSVCWVLETTARGLKRPGLEADHLPPSAEGKNSAAIPLLPHTSSCHGAHLSAHLNDLLVKLMELPDNRRLKDICQMICLPDS